MSIRPPLTALAALVGALLFATHAHAHDLHPNPTAPNHPHPHTHPPTHTHTPTHIHTPNPAPQTQEPTANNPPVAKPSRRMRPYVAFARSSAYQDDPDNPEESAKINAVEDDSAFVDFIIGVTSQFTGKRNYYAGAGELAVSVGGSGVITDAVFSNDAAVQFQSEKRYALSFAPGYRFAKHNRAYLRLSANVIEGSWQRYTDSTRSAFSNSHGTLRTYGFGWGLGYEFIYKKLLLRVEFESLSYSANDDPSAPEGQETESLDLFEADEIRAVVGYVF